MADRRETVLDQIAHCEAAISGLFGAFAWDLTKEGHKFWCEVVDKIDRETKTLRKELEDLRAAS